MKADDQRETVAEWLGAEPFTLVFSSGFFGFFAHAGMLRALERAGIQPAGVAGSSAGALVAGLWGSGLDADEICQRLVGLQRADFWDPGVGLGLLAGRRFRELLEDSLPVARFEQCRVSVRMSVFDLGARRTEILDRGALSTAIHASCAFPVLFQPVEIDGRLYSDGGIADRPGLDTVVEGQRVFYHHLSSKSPWRRKASAALQVPARENMLSITAESLPRVGPFRLRRGALALEAAYAAVSRALERPASRIVSVS